MTQIEAREIVQSLPSLYALKDYEEEAILKILTPKTFIRVTNQGDSYDDLFCPHCGTEVYNEEDNFCRKCGQPFIDE